jgi:DNA-binding NtrC family response regulator
VVLRMPPLRERKNDIPLFVEHFVKQFAKEYEITPPKLTRSVMEALHEHPWPGNTRELRNVVSRLLLQTLDGPITESFVADALHLWKTPAGDLASGPAFPAAAPQPGAPWGNWQVPILPQPGATNSGASSALPTLEQNEKAHIEKALRLSGGKLSGPGGAADLLGVPRSTLQHRMRKLDIK